MIDDATIKRVAGESGAEAWWVSGNEDSVEFYAVLHQFARAIEQLARAEQREEDARVCIQLINRISDPIVIGFDRADGGTNALTNAAIAIRAAGKGK